MMIPRDCAAGTAWEYPAVDDYLPISYYMEAKQSITTACGTWSCHTRNTSVHEDDPYGYEYRDFFSGPGLVKFLYEAMIEMTDEQGNLLGIFPYSDQLQLLSYELN